MKIRTDFVTNSSTSSFCIVGTSFERPTNPNGADLYEIADKTGLQLYSNEGDYYYAGMLIRNMPENVTLKQYKDRAKKKVDEFIEECKKAGIELPADLTVEIIEETVTS